MAADLLPTDPLTWDNPSLQAQDKAFSLLVVQDGETYTYPLPPSGRLLIGRAPHADVRIDHGSVSREHAALHVGDLLQIEDLDSANGSRLREAPLRPRVPVEVFPDDVIDLGAVLLVIQYRRLEQRLRRSCERAFFELRVAEECEQTALSGSPFALAEVDVQGGLGTHAVQLLLASQLRQQDLITNLVPGKYQILLPACSPEDARARVELMRGQMRQRSLGVRTTLRCCPRDGNTAAALLGRAFVGERSVAQELPDFVVRDESMKRVSKLLSRVAESDVSLLLLGEAGVGKMRCAELVHARSSRAMRPFVRVNCAAIPEPEALFDRELLGYEAGAFAEATAPKPGLLESASGGTLFLAYVESMPLGTQTKLLRVLESRQVSRLGGHNPHPVDLRVISTSHHDLRERVTAGQFREDLYHRLNGISVVVPPLRERHDDIEPLARYFLQLHTRAERSAPVLSAAALDLLEAQPWPGNLRGLDNMVERASVFCQGDVIEPQHLGLEAGLTRLLGLRDEVRSLERQRIEHALRESGGNQRLAAEKLGLSRGALLRRLELLGIARPRKVSDS